MINALKKTFSKNSKVMYANEFLLTSITDLHSITDLSDTSMEGCPAGGGG